MFYERFREIRRDNNAMQKEVASILGIAVTQYSRYERGYQEFPFHLAIKFAKWFNISLDYLSGEIDQKRPLNEKEEEEYQKELMEMGGMQTQNKEKLDNEEYKNLNEMTTALENEIKEKEIIVKLWHFIDSLPRETLLRIINSTPKDSKKED